MSGVTHQHDGGPLGFLDGRPLPRTELDRRLAELRTGPRSASLPKPGTAEDRQLTRWVAQVVLTEELCAAEAAARGLAPAEGTAVRLDRRAAVELGSIAAAAFERSPWVRAMYRAIGEPASVTGLLPHGRDPGSPAEAAGARPRWRIASPDGDYEADPDTLPAELAAALRAAGPGREVTVGTWRATLVDEAPRSGVEADDGGDGLHHRRRAADPAAPADPGDVREAARRQAFVRWLDQARAERLTLVPGLEHPGDPSQPDNHHQH